MSRYAILEQIQQLDPLKDCAEITRLIYCYEFPWDQQRALEIALYRTYCVPAISTLLYGTGELTNHTQKRYDDTALILSEIATFGFESERGRAALRRMNRIHQHFSISNEEYLYVLSTFIYEPIRWNARFGWRKMCQREKLASYYFWREVGRRMYIKNIPDSYEGFELFNIGYEQSHFHYADTNKCVAAATRDLFLSWIPLPNFLRTLLKPALYALLDEAMLDAFGFPRPSQALRVLVEGMLKLRGFALRFFPPRKKPFLYVERRHRSYPKGYTLTQLGPEDMLEELNETAKMP